MYIYVPIVYGNDANNNNNNNNNNNTTTPYI